MKHKENGQILLILLLVMVVALAISLSIIQRSLSDLSNATKVEQSSRAFSAAEAGIEKTLQSGATPAPFTLGNSSQVQVSANIQFPRAGEALEYPALAKEDIAHVWLADYTQSTNPIPIAYTPQKLQIYWGDYTRLDDKAAIEVTLYYIDRGRYDTTKWFFDSDLTRVGQNKFTLATCSSINPYKLHTNLSNDSVNPDRPFYCMMPVDLSNVSPAPSASAYLVLVRVRLLYNTTSQPLAVAPVATGCSGSGCNIPNQASIFTSTGTSGETQRKVQVFQINKVVPFYFDFAIFSAGEITK